ncbi:MAG: S8 family serine peptidase, partial [Myxococcota bacterium]
KAAKYAFASIRGQGSFDELTVELLKAFRPRDVKAANSKTKLLSLFKDAKAKSVKALETRMERAQDRLDTRYNVNFDPRAEIIGDDPFDFSDHNYGNPDVVGPTPRHGSHVGSIAGSTRNNGKGIDGIAHDVRLMILRAVPSGDEWDKDVANSIRYAVDNGADIINMSFGKPLSPGKAAVDAAVAYAAEHGVLLIHSAGNESLNTDKTPTYPNPWIGDSNTERFDNWITVGASSADLGSRLVAYFSNYGQRTVELFAPGVKVKAALPGRNDDGEWRYGALSGTSMAAPTVAGVAALVLSQYPELSPTEVRSLLMKTTRKLPGLMVQKPGGKDDELVPFESLSSTGGIVDAYAALQEAMTLYGEERQAAA